MCVENTGTLSLDDLYFHHNSPVDNATFGGVVTAFSASDAEQIDLSITHSLFEEKDTAIPPPAITRCFWMAPVSGS